MANGIRQCDVEMLKTWRTVKGPAASKCWMFLFLFFLFYFQFCCQSYISVVILCDEFSYSSKQWHALLFQSGSLEVVRRGRQQYLCNIYLCLIWLFFESLGCVRSTKMLRIANDFFFRSVSRKRIICLSWYECMSRCGVLRREMRKSIMMISKNGFRYTCVRFDMHLLTVGVVACIQSMYKHHLRIYRKS